MSDKLQYDLRNDTDVQESTEMASLSSKNKEGLNSNNELRAKVDGHQKSLSETEEIIQKLTSLFDKSRHTLFVNFQKSLSVKDETILELSTEVDGQNKVAEEYQKRLSEKEEVISEKDEAIQVDRQKDTAEEYQRNLSEKEGIIHELTSRIDKLIESAGEYQNILTEKDKTLSGKEDTISQLTTQVDGQNNAAKKSQKICRRRKK